MYSTQLSMRAQQRAAVLFVTAGLALLPYWQGFSGYTWPHRQLSETDQPLALPTSPLPSASSPTPTSAPRPQHASRASLQSIEGSVTANYAQKNVSATATDASAAATDASAAASNWRPGQPLPFPLRNCSAALFRHLGKTGGSTIQAVFRRNEQLGVRHACQMACGPAHAALHTHPPRMVARLCPPQFSSVHLPPSEPAV